MLSSPEFEFPATDASAHALESARQAAAAPVPWNLAAESARVYEQWLTYPVEARAEVAAALRDRLAELLAIWHIDMTPEEFLADLYAALGGPAAQGSDLYRIGAALRAGIDALPRPAADLQ